MSRSCVGLLRLTDLSAIALPGADVRRMGFEAYDDRREKERKILKLDDGCRWVLPERTQFCRVSFFLPKRTQFGIGRGTKRLIIHRHVFHFQADSVPGKIDKSVLTFGETRRLRDKTHLKFVRTQPCLICARSPADAHHLRFAQPRAMGRKVSDEFTVPLCRTHHRDNHSFGDEVAWWERRAIDPVATARMLWISTRRLK